MDKQWRVPLESEMMLEAFRQHFAKLYEVCGGPEGRVDVSAYLQGLP